MAKIVVNYDTETKELNMSVDGNEPLQLHRFSSYSEISEDEKYGYFEADLKPSKQNGVKYGMYAQGSEIMEKDILQDFVRQSLTKNQK